MRPEFPPDTLKIYQLVKRTDMMFSYAGSGSTQNIGFGFYTTRQEAEHQRTLEVLKQKENDNSEYYVFELEIPNPIVK